jgi:hypothetical protein
MKIFISEFDRYNAYKAAILPVAKFHNIENLDFKSLYEIYLQLLEIESPIFNELKDYLAAYDSWFEFYSERKQIESKQNIAYELNDSEKLILANLIQKREKSLGNLLTKFKEISM